jgi:hypothetical protein
MFALYRLLPLCCILPLAGIAAGEASGQGLPPPLTQYAAKFACGRVAPIAGAVGGDVDVVVGVYATSINIHNSQATVPVKFRKKIVVANREGEHSGQIVVRDDVLQPDTAEFVDCPLIYKLLEIPPTAVRHIEGFVVLQIPAAAGHPVFTLDVVGKYSARPFNGEVSSFDVVVYDAKHVDN